MTGYRKVHEEVRAHSDSAVLVAVSKMHPYEAVLDAYADGARIFGENRVQEAESKFPPMSERPDGMKLYIIGQLQRNKVKRALQIADRIESVDSLPLIEKIEKEAAVMGRQIEVLLELNSSEEEQKAGFRSADELIEAATIDGCTPYSIFTKIMLPLAKNTFVTIASMYSILIWNDFIFANTFISRNSAKTVAMGLKDYVGAFGNVDWGLTFAAIAISILPPMIVYFALNKQVTAGMTIGATKSIR